MDYYYYYIGLTHAGIWVACCSYITSAFAQEFQTLTLGFLRAIHYGFGRGLGAIFGGLVISSYGIFILIKIYIINFLTFNVFLKLKIIKNYFLFNIVNNETFICLYFF